jgi:putative inorganic carbon (HCO3(-)) transporter
MQQHNYLFAVNRTIAISLFFLFVCVPLIVNPFTHDFWYKPKIDAICVLIVIITIAGALRHFLLRVPFYYKPIPVLIPLVAFAGSAILSTLFSIAPHLSLFGDPMREESISTLLAYAALTVIFSQFVGSEKQFHSLMKGLILASLLISLNGIANYWGYYPIKQLVPYSGYLVGSTIGNPNFLGKFLVLIVPLCMAYYCVSKNRVETIYCAVGLLACIFALVLTFTRASWLSFFVEILIFFVLAGRKIFRKDGKKIAASILIISLIVSIFFLLLAPNKEKSFFDLARKKITASFDFGKGRGVATRLFVWKKTIDIIKERPVLGYGPDTHSKAMETFNLEYCLKFNNWSLRKRGDQEVISFSGLTLLDRAHNNYLDVTISQGLVGLAAYMSTVITFLIWLIRRIKRENDSYMRIIHCGIFASFCGYLFNDFFIFSVVSVSPTFWSIMGLTLAMNTKKNKRSDLTLSIL